MRLWITILLVAALAGCSSRQRESSRQTAWSVSLMNQSRYSEFIISADGRELPPDRHDGRDWHFMAPLRAGPDGTPILPSFSARVQTPCGWREAELDVREPLAPTVTAVSLVLHAGALTENARLWVDNRRRPAARLRVNGEERVIPANEATHLQLTYEQCAAAREVSVDGKVVGMLPERTPQRKGGLDFNNPLDVHYFLLLDTSGTGCYAYTEHCYAKKDFLTSCGELQTHVYRGKQLHHVPRAIDFFFTAAPKQTEVATAYSSETLASLKDCGAN